MDTNKLNLDAYYYSFEPTGVDAVDTILSAVANAGAGYHNTEDWREQRDDGSSPLSDMQTAAEKSAEAFRALLAEVERLRTAEGDAMTYKAGMENVAQQRDQIKAEVEELSTRNKELTNEIVAVEFQKKILGEALKKDRAELDQLKAEIEAFKAANAELSEINTARRNHLSNAKKAAGIGPMDDLVGAIEALRKLAVELRGAAKCYNLHHCKAEQHAISEPCKVLARIDAAMSKEAIQ